MIKKILFITCTRTGIQVRYMLAPYMIWETFCDTSMLPAPIFDQENDAIIVVGYTDNRH